MSPRLVAQIDAALPPRCENYSVGHDCAAAGRAFDGADADQGATAACTACRVRAIIATAHVERMD